MTSRMFLWWGAEIRDFDAMCRERGWVEREEIEGYVLEQLPGHPNKVRLDVPTDYWSDIENPDLDSAGEVDLLELEGIAHYPDVKIEFRLVLRMGRGEDSDVEWKVLKMQRKYA